MTGQSLHARTSPASRPLSSQLYAKVRFLRRVRGISAQELADRMTAQGFAITRAQIANAETGRVRDMSVDYADHAARALGTDLVAFLADPSPCTACAGFPPDGFTCNTCGLGGDR